MSTAYQSAPWRPKRCSDQSPSDGQSLEVPRKDAKPRHSGLRRLPSAPFSGMTQAAITRAGDARLSRLAQPASLPRAQPSAFVILYP